MNVVISFEEVEALVRSDYADRDIMHDLAHIDRLRKLAKEIARNYEHDPQLLELGAYFHGNISFKEAEIRQFLKDKQLEQHEIDKVVRVAWESQKESNAQTIAWLYSLKVDLEVVCPGFSF